MLRIYTITHNLSIHNADNTVNLISNFIIMCNDNNCSSRLMKIFQNIHDLNSRLTVQVTGRLIGKDDRRLCGNCSGYSNTLLLSTGKLVRSVIHTIFQSNFR